MLNKAQPDYAWWAKADSWSFADAALLLHDIDPCSCRLFGLPTEIPLDFSEVHRTCSLLKSIAWKEKYPFHTGKGLHPLAVVTEAIKKELPLPQSLRQLITQRFADENLHNEKSTPTLETKTNNQTLANRERRTYLKAIGILITLLMDGKKIPATRGQKPSASQVAQMMLEKAESLGMDDEGLKSIDRKITEALALLAEEAATL